MKPLGVFLKITEKREGVCSKRGLGAVRLLQPLGGLLPKRNSEREGGQAEFN